MKNETVTPERIDFHALDSFTRAYIICALWSSHDESDESGGEPMDANYSAEDLTQGALAQIKSDCERFQREQAPLLAQAGNSEQNGHDFWLTRNGHGAGFWDRGYDVGDSLTVACKEYGECNLYVTDSGEIDLM